MTPFQFMVAGFCVLVGVIFLALAALVVYSVVIGVRRVLKKEGKDHERQ